MKIGIYFASKHGQARKIYEFTPWDHVERFAKDFANDEEAKKIGVRGYVSKAQAGATLLAAVDALLHNQTFFP